MENTEERGTSDLSDVPVRPKGRPGRKPKGTAPVVIPETPDKPDPDHVLTWRQRKVLQVIRDSVQKRGYPPSMREIGEAVGLTSTSSVSYQLSTLQKKGYLHRDVGRPRTVEVRLPGHPAVRPEQNNKDADAELVPSADGLDIASQEATYVPLVGRIAAGGPILVDQVVEADILDATVAALAQELKLGAPSVQTLIKKLVTQINALPHDSNAADILGEHVHDHHPGTELVIYPTRHRGDALLIGVE